jgi:Stress responsive A/B Barrel Domain
MLKHILCLKLKDFAEGNPKSENAKLAKEKLLALKEKIKEIKYIEAGINDAKASPDNFDVVLITEFESFDDLDIYQKHPEHVKTADFMKKIRDARACVDFET